MQRGCIFYFVKQIQTIKEKVKVKLLFLIFSDCNKILILLSNQFFLITYFVSFMQRTSYVHKQLK